MKQKMLFLLVLSQLFSVVGTIVIQFTLSLYVLDVTGSALIFSFITSLAVAGRLVMLPFCGILADRINKRRVMLMMDGSYLLVALALFFIISWEQNLWLIGFLTCLMGMISAFETPVVQSAIPLIASSEEIPQANSAVSGIGILGNMFGPILAGVVYQPETIQWIFLGCMGLFVLALGVEWLLHFEEPIKKQYTSLLQVIKEDSLEIFAYLKENKMIVKICSLAFLLNLFLSSFIQVVVPYIARIQLLVSNQAFGIMNFLFAFGGLLGTICYGVFAKKFQLRSIPKQLIVTALLFFSLLVPLGLADKSNAFWGMTVAVAILLALVTMISLQLVVFIQTAAPPQLLGRLMSFVMIVSTLATPLGQVFFGGLSNLLPASQMGYLVIGIGLITLLIAVGSRWIFGQGEKKTVKTSLLEK